MRLSPNDKFFVFMSRDKADPAASCKQLEEADGIEIVDGFSGTFRVRTTQIIADQERAGVTLIRQETTRLQ